MHVHNCPPRIPAEAGIQSFGQELDSRLGGNERSV